SFCIIIGLTSICRVTAQEWDGVYPRNGCVPRAPEAKAENYSSWIEPYAKPLRKENSGNKKEIDLSLTVLDGDDLAPDPTAGIRLCGNYCCQMRTTYSVSSGGTVSTTRITPMAVQGGGPSSLPNEKLRSIQKLIADLLRHPPDDNAILPPHGRRLVLHVEDNRKTVVRVYDRADIPAPVQEVLGLIGATSGPLWMDFKPSVKNRQELSERSISAAVVGIRVPHDSDPVTKALSADTATLAISPDGAMTVTQYFFLNPRVVLTDRLGEKLSVPDYTIDRRWISVSHAFFTPDSRYLLLLSNLPAIHIYDTRTGKSVDTLPGLPAEASAFYPSSDWKHGVAVLRSGQVESWDVLKRRKQADLDLDGNLQDVSFSEDSSLFAVSSVRLNPDSSSTFRLRVWDTNTGRFLREMVPPYYFEQDEMSKPMWWDHGKYLLADVRAGHWGGGYMVAIWNAQSGQLRGGFSACDHSEDPYAVGIDKNRLLKWCRDDTLMVWDLPTAVQKITEFEQSLNRNEIPNPPRRYAHS